MNNNYKNIILIDNTVKNYNEFYESVNNDTFAIIYNYLSNKEDILKNFSDLSNIDRLCFIFDEENLLNRKFIDNDIFFTDDDISNINEDNVNNLSKNFLLLIDIIKKLNIKYVDFLACNSLNNLKWKYFYNKLNKLTNVIVGASNDKTGNEKYGGNWILQSTNTDIKNIYFTCDIENYIYTLSSISTPLDLFIKQENTNFLYSIDNINWSYFGFPFGIINSNSQGNTINITFITNMLLNDNNQYFYCGSEKITFTCNDNVVFTIDNINDYDGLIQNGTQNDIGFDNITVENIILNMNESFLNFGAGWICQSYFKGTVNNCNSSGIISSQSSGGIIGSNSISTVNNCSSSGNIVGTYAGGICGSNSSSTLNNCSSSGDINGNSSGGIIGGQSNGSVVNNCYSIGIITSPGAGGIIGTQTNNSTANDCYSIGNIIGESTGGIFGSECSDSTTMNCYSLGTISGNYSGGIFGYSSSNCNAINCYSSGTISGNEYTKGIFGGSDASGNNCYVANGSWNDATAQNSLNTNNIYTSPQINTPYLLLSYNDNFYNGITQANILKGQFTNLETNFYENEFYWVTNSNILINQYTGQMTSLSIGYYNYYVILGFPSINITFPSKPYGYNIINFSLVVNQKPFFNMSNYYDEKNRKKTRKQIKKFIDKL